MLRGMVSSIGVLTGCGARYPSVTKRLLSFPSLRHAVNVSQPTTTTRTSDPDATTVERLLQPAAHASADKGFHATTTRDIASGAGLSPAGVYVHFDSKEELLFALSRSGHESALRLLRSALADGSSPTQQLVNVMTSFSEWHAEQYQVARVVQYEHHHLTPE